MPLPRSTARPRTQVQPPIARWPGITAALLALASALVSTYWLIGGTWGVRSLGGSLERLARDRPTGGLIVLFCVVVAKLTAAALAASLSDAHRPRWLARLAVTSGVLLALYGGLLVTVGALVLAGAIPAEGADRYALAWHVGLWDLWFFLWGSALAMAGWLRLRRTTPATAR